MNPNSDTSKATRSLPARIFDFYVEGFRSMTVGKTLWLIILIKLFIMFAILRLFFFPNQLNRFDNDEERAEHVRTELLKK